jgi:hypothetical protein
MSSFKNIILSLGLIGIFSATCAQASFLIEPHIGYNISGGEGSYSGTKYEYSGAQYGARLGGQFLGVMGGFAYNHSAFDLKKTTLSSLSTSTAARTQNEMGVFAGYSAPILVRAWVGYYFSTKSTLDSNTSTYDKGTTTEFGVGFTPIPFFSLNAEYRMVSFDSGYKPTEIVLGISLPFTLL